VIAGACATILKAFFFEGALVSGAVAPSDDGLSLTSADGLGLTLGGELNKLAGSVTESFGGFQFTKFDGTRVLVTPQGSTS